MPHIILPIWYGSTIRGHIIWLVSYNSYKISHAFHLLQNLVHALKVDSIISSSSFQYQPCPRLQLCFFLSMLRDRWFQELELRPPHNHLQKIWQFCHNVWTMQYCSFMMIYNLWVMQTFIWLQSYKFDIQLNSSTSTWCVVLLQITNNIVKILKCSLLFG